MMTSTGTEPLESIAMSSPSRRAFLGTSLATLAFAHPLGAQQRADDAVKSADDPAFQPSTLFLTWQRDPTTTMTVQWVGARGETADTTVSYTAAKIGPWQNQPTTAKP